MGRSLWTARKGGGADGAIGKRMELGRRGILAWAAVLRKGAFRLFS
jgi:hypothetical protein